MVILQFNKLIRNKWVWGAFAVVVSLAFLAPDEWLRGSEDPRNRDQAVRNKLPGVEYDGALLESCEHLVREFLPNFPRSPLARSFSKNSVRDFWKAYAAVKTFTKAGYSIPDELLAGRIKAMFSDGQGGFSEKAYSSMVKRAFNIDPTAFESQMRLLMTLEAGIEGVVTSSMWTPSMPAEQANRDFTDKFTVRVATFEEDKKAADAIKLDDAGLKKWYDANNSSIALPERFRLRFVKYDATASNLLAKVSVDEESIKKRYDENAAKGMYDIKPATTNDVKKTKPLEEVRSGILAALKQEAALEQLKKDVRAKTAIDDEDAETVKNLLPSLAKADNLKIETSDWFTLDGRFVAGFMKSPSSLFPGVPRKDFDRTVKLLKDYGYGIFASSRAVWVAELAETSPAHTPSFEEAKGKIGDNALRDAKKDAFKASVEAIAAKGVDAVLASKNVTTNIVFAPCKFAKDYATGWENRYGSWDFRNSGFENAEKVVFAARSLQEGGVSPFVQLGAGKGALVVCVKRGPGDPADIYRGESFARMATLSQLSSDGSIDAWLDSNLSRLGWKEPVASRASSVDIDE